MRSVVITGGASGIGAATASKLIREGYRVFSIDRTNADCCVDLATESGRAEAIRRCQEHFPEGINGLVTCAGVGPDAEPISLIQDVNFSGTTLLVEGLRDLLSLQKAPVVLVSSNSANQPADAIYVQSLVEGDLDAARLRLNEINAEAPARAGLSAYVGSKLAVAQWMRKNIQEFSRLGIRMNAVAPGYTKTPMVTKVNKTVALSELTRNYLDLVPLGRPATPEDQASVIYFLLSSSSSYVNGSVLFIDGGQDAMLRPNHI